MYIILSVNSKFKIIYLFIYGFIYSFKMFGCVWFVFFVLVMIIIGYVYNIGWYYLIIKWVVVCREEDGYLWYENECVCVDGRIKCCCGFEGIWCI